MHGRLAFALLYSTPARAPLCPSPLSRFILFVLFPPGYIIVLDYRAYADGQLFEDTLARGKPIVFL